MRNRSKGGSRDEGNLHGPPSPQDDKEDKDKPGNSQFQYYQTIQQTISNARGITTETFSGELASTIISLTAIQEKSENQAKLYYDCLDSYVMDVGEKLLEHDYNRLDSGIADLKQNMDARIATTEKAASNLRLEAS